ncbi:hypothetical protein IH785_02650 [candidate division KSB1 bacterium]|nr:hypothetical protein [candidate division KSB1 bacterium]
MAKPKDPLSKWKSPLLLIVFSFLFFESLSGFLLFFFGQFLRSSTALATVHWILGIAAYYRMRFTSGNTISRLGNTLRSFITKSASFLF